MLDRLTSPRRPRRRRGLLPGRRVTPGNPLLEALGRADQAALRALRTRGHFEPLETAMKAVGLAGEFAAVWAAIGGVGAARDGARRGQWLAAAAIGPAAIGVNFAVKVATGRRRPLIEEHPPLARAPTKLSFPSAHATSSLAAATALGRVSPRLRPAALALAATICVGRPYLGMHYPSDVVGGAALGAVLGSLVPGLGRDRARERDTRVAAPEPSPAESGEPTATAAAGAETA